MVRTVGIAVFSCVFVMGGLGASADTPRAGAGQAAASTPGASVAAPPSTQAAVTYFSVPVFGQLGTDVNPVALDVAFNEAEQAHASYVVMLFDTPGGDPNAVSAMIRTVSSHPHVQSIAFVRRATGAAALLAASCDKLYVYKSGIWGTTGESDCDQVQACKAELAQVIAAKRRNARILAALANPGSELYLQTVDGKPSIQSTRAADSRVLKHPGSALVLTPQDMVTCQVADGVCATMGDIRKELGVENWDSCGDRGAEIVQSLRQAPKPMQVVIESQSQQAEAPADPALSRDEMYYKARAEEQQRYLDAQRKQQDRAYEERRRWEEERRAQENREHLRRQDAANEARKRREMDEVGHRRGF